MLKGQAIWEYMVNTSAFEVYTDTDGLFCKISLYPPLPADDPKHKHLRKKHLKDWNNSNSRS